MNYFLLAVIAIVFLEAALMILVKWVRRKFQWFITADDEFPVMSKDGMEKFFQFGYDAELGWIRKPNTSHNEKGKYGKTSFHIDENGARNNPSHEKLNSTIACFGDSFAFCRQVNDNETWQWYLSEMTNSNASNFGVGNYGIDQAYLRLEREISNIKPSIVLMGVVPSTIVRILCIWKHYNEFGNTFGFKPRFDFKDGKLILIKNIIDSKSRFFEYKKYINEIRERDYFYLTKFKKEMIRFPFSYYFLKNPIRNFSISIAMLLCSLFGVLGVKCKTVCNYPLQKIMNINLKLRRKLFQHKYACDIFSGILDKFIQLSKEKQIMPIFVLLPQKDDVLFVKKKHNYYNHFLEEMRKKIFIIDLTQPLLEVNNLDFLYSDDGVYGGHFSKDGNKFVAEFIFDQLKRKGHV
ncbi:MAG: hypothetical protein HY841_03420 [Bacteroidetes bacterium]|nr:hypothetical protein [Bacteroidota bacterium]